MFSAAASLTPIPEPGAATLIGIPMLFAYWPDPGHTTIGPKNTRFAIDLRLAPMDGALAGVETVSLAAPTSANPHDG